MPLLVVYGVLFAAFNACFEEFITRALLYDGFPGGPVGVVMVFVWSLFLGAMRWTSGGMVAPLVAHFFADLTIGGILLFAIVV